MAFHSINSTIQDMLTSKLVIVFHFSGCPFHLTSKLNSSLWKVVYRGSERYLAIVQRSGHRRSREWLPCEHECASVHPCIIYCIHNSFRYLALTWGGYVIGLLCSLFGYLYLRSMSYAFPSRKYGTDSPCFWNSHESFVQLRRTVYGTYHSFRVPHWTAML